MSQRLKNKNIIVTAAGQGIGKATAIAFCNEGANVIATDLNEKTLIDLNKEYPKIKVFTLDSTDYNAIKTFAKTIDKVDVLFNAVGFVHHGTILDCEEKDWDFSFNVNIKSMYFMIKSIIPKMLKVNSGNIINIASVASSIKGFPFRFVYGASKAAIIGLTKSIAADFVKQNIRCNAIAPGFVETDMTHYLKEGEAATAFLSKIPLGRFGKAEEIANTTLFLASDMSSYVTGQVISACGGLNI